MGRGLGGQLSWEGAGEGRKGGVWSAGEPRRVTPGDLQEVSRKRLRDREAEPPGASRKKRRGLGASKGTGGQAGVGGKSKGRGLPGPLLCVAPALEKIQQNSPSPLLYLSSICLEKTLCPPLCPQLPCPIATRGSQQRQSFLARCGGRGGAGEESGGHPPPSPGPGDRNRWG